MSTASWLRPVNRLGHLGMYNDRLTLVAIGLRRPSSSPINLLASVEREKWLGNPDPAATRYMV
jgi:hypothetical protein